MLGLESPSGWEEASAAAGNGVGPKRALCSCQLGLQTPALLANRFDCMCSLLLSALLTQHVILIYKQVFFKPRPLKQKVGLVFASTNISEVYSGTFHEDKLSNETLLMKML